MPTYPVINLERKRTKVLFNMTMKGTRSGEKIIPGWDRGLVTRSVEHSREFRWT